MKKIMSLIAFTICNTCSFAQTQTEQKIDSAKLRNFLKQTWVIDLLKRQQQSYKVYDTARYDHKGSGGDVYILPQHGMPCLRPDTSAYTYNMPQPLFIQRQPFILKDGTKLIKPAPDNRMPNAYEGKPLVWSKRP